MPSEKLIAKVEKWAKENRTAQHIIISGLHNTIFNGLWPFSTAQELWEQLLTTYGVITEDQVVSLFTELVSFKIKGNERVNAVYSRFEDILNRLANAGEFPAEKLKLSLLLRRSRRAIMTTNVSS